MTARDDPFARHDAAYVLGALSPKDRREFEAHLSGCTACASSVADLAGLPGLLARASADAVAEPVPDTPGVPDTLLPRLMAASGGERRTRRRKVAVAGALAAGALAAGLVALGAVLAGDHQDDLQSPGRPVAMTAVRPAPVEATVRLQQVAWGTKVYLRCTYVGESPSQRPYDRVLYRLVVITRDDGREQTIARWAVRPGEDATVNGSTNLAPSQIGQLRLEAADGTVLLEGEPG